MLTRRRKKIRNWTIAIAAFPLIFSHPIAFAQTSEIPSLPADLLPPRPIPPLVPKTPPETPEDPLQLPDSPTSTPISPSESTATITISEFIFEGNTAFSNEELAEAVKEYRDRPLSFSELLQVPDKITQYYLDAEYITSGAYLPSNQTFTGENAVIRIQIVEGSIEEIRIENEGRLHPDYIRSRLHLATKPPLNRDRLVAALQLLQQNPLITTVSAELGAGSRAGTNVLDIVVTEADSFSVQLPANNARSPSVGSFRRGVGFTEANLFGIGDGLGLNYGNTDGSNSFDLSYTLPINARNGTLNLSAGVSKSTVIEHPFDRLDIQSDSRYYRLTLRQPIWQTPTEEFTLTLSGDRAATETSVLGIPFPLTPGADDAGKLRTHVLRLAQELKKQGNNQIFAARSQVSLGIGLFDATLNADGEPDSNFLTWRGQVQWVRFFGSSPPVSTFLIRGDIQLADRPLVSSEKLGLGGASTVRGYRQDILLVDNGLLASAEFRLPVVNIPEWETVVRLISFIDFGIGWNSGDGEQPEQNTLASVGLGLEIVQSPHLSARLDWGIPLIDIPGRNQTWQENGIHFHLQFLF